MTSMHILKDNHGKVVTVPTIHLFICNFLAFLPGKSHEHRSLAGYSPWGHKRDGHDLVTKQNTTNLVIIFGFKECGHS